MTYAFTGAALFAGIAFIMLIDLVRYVPRTLQSSTPATTNSGTTTTVPTTITTPIQTNETTAPATSTQPTQTYYAPARSRSS